MQWVNATRDYASALFGIRRAVGLAPARDADVDGACFADCNLEGADFERARNIERADFTGSNWRRAKFDPHIAAMLAARYPETDEREEDVAQAEKVTAGAENATRSGLTLPILHPERGSVLGVVNIEHQQVEAFSESTVEAMRRLVTALAAHLVRLTEPPDATQQTPT